MTLLFIKKIIDYLGIREVYELAKLLCLNSYNFQGGDFGSTVQGEEEVSWAKTRIWIPLNRD